MQRLRCKLSSQLTAVLPNRCPRSGTGDSEKLLRFLEEALRGRLIGITADLGKIFEQLALLGGERGRHFDMSAHQLITLSATAQRRHALIAQTKGCAALSAGRDFKRGFAK